MKIGFIGAGKVGSAFAKYLKNCNQDVIGFYSKSPESISKACQFVGGVQGFTLKELVNVSDLIFITTSDDQISVLAEEIVGLKLELRDKRFCHMSGAHSIETLKPLKKAGGFCYSLHPLQAFANSEDAFEKLPVTVFSFETIKEDEEMLSLLKAIGNKYFTIDSKDKSLYHMAACIISNYLVTILDQGFKVLQAIGVNETLATEAFLPLINGTIDNVVKLGTEQALTGPISRGDLETVKTHLKAVEGDEGLKSFYTYIGRLTTELAKESGKIGKETRDDLLQVLETNSPTGR